MSDAPASAAPTEPFLAFPLHDQAEARHLLRALMRGAIYAVREAEPDERPKAHADAAAYDALRDRLLSLLARRELELGLDETEASD
jgi:hypothetical protein